jgi:hypothetical protein
MTVTFCARWCERLSSTRVEKCYHTVDFVLKSIRGSGVVDLVRHEWAFDRKRALGWHHLALRLRSTSRSQRDSVTPLP